MIPENWAEKPPPSHQDEGKFCDLISIHFRQFWATLVLVAEKPPPHKDEGKFFDLRWLHFKQFWATLVLVAEKPPPRMRDIFWPQIYAFQGISSNFGFGGRKAPPPQDEGKFFDLRSIHFRQFRATLVLVAEKPPPTPGWGKIFWYLIHHTRTSTRYERLFAGNGNPSSLMNLTNTKIYLTNTLQLKNQREKIIING